ncbi:hypothetical protein FJTKL_13725 [Diaporthe vaccinii]|uniref:Uncharacterized protein n=1 Tax=Diaporthe vaccinii TaxID=105482 RepID=A0ABR4E9U8_9PEZI
MGIRILKWQKRTSVEKHQNRPCSSIDCRALHAFSGDMSYCLSRMRTGVDNTAVRHTKRRQYQCRTS